MTPPRSTVSAADAAPPPPRVEDASAPKDAERVTVDAAPSYPAKAWYFDWKPKGAHPAAYEFPTREDQHRLYVAEGADPAVPIPVFIYLHGQPFMKKLPRDYYSPSAARQTVQSMRSAGDIGPIALVTPVFRFLGANWPSFDLKDFRAVVEEQLAKEGYRAGDFYVAAESGAAGCTGDGINRAHRLQPKGVAFLDTCPSTQMREEVIRLKTQRIPTLIVHSVQVLGNPEFSSTYDYGRFLAPAGIAPIPCPPEDKRPRAPLRKQSHRCAASSDGNTRAFVLDTGEGQDAHSQAIRLGFHFFVREMFGTGQAR